MEEKNENLLTKEEMRASAWWYKMRFMSLILCVVAAVTFGCSKDDAVNQPSDPTTSVTTPTENEPEKPDTPTEDTPTTPVQKHNVELEFWRGNEHKICSDTVQKYIKNPEIDTVYLVLNKGSTYSSMTQQQITMCKNKMEKCTQIDEKRVRGRGNFWFESGAALPADSLWFVSKGWTVNKH